MSATADDALDALARELGREAAEVHREAEGYRRELRTGHSDAVYARIVGAGRRLLRRGYERLDYDPAGVERLRAELAQHACVVLASHRSYLDGGVLTVGFHDHGLPPLTVFGGINMAFWPVGPVWRRANGVFIRRGGTGPVYHHALRRAVAELLARRRPLQWFVEGTRSRDGRFGRPKQGLLAYVVDAWRDGAVPDVKLLPVAIAYDRLREVDEYAAEAAGRAKQAESLGWLWRFVRAQRGRLGAVHVRVGEPVSLRATLGPPESLPPRGSEAMRAGVAALAQAAVDALERAMPVTGTALVARTLLEAGGGGPAAEAAGAAGPGAAGAALGAVRAAARALAGAAADAGRPLASGARLGDDAAVDAVLRGLLADGALVVDDGRVPDGSASAATLRLRATPAGAYALRWYANGAGAPAQASGVSSQASTSA